MQSSTKDSAAPLFLSVPKAGRAFGLGRERSYDEAKRGNLPVVAFGRALRVPTAKVADMLGLTLDELWTRLQEDETDAA